jgi:hypothetical protein
MNHIRAGASTRFSEVVKEGEGCNIELVLVPNIYMLACSG